MNHTVRLICGGDFLKQQGVKQADKDSVMRFYRRRKNVFLRPIINSLSEHRDIVHDRILKRELDKLVLVKRPTIIWERSSRLHAAGLDVAKEYGIPFVHEWKDNLIPYRFSLQRSRALKVEKRKEQEADSIVVESKVLKDDLIAKGIDERKIFVVHNAVEANKFTRDVKKGEAFRSRLSISKNDVVIGYLGSYAFYHDTKRLVLAADIIKAKGLGNIKIIMVGDGKEYAETRALAEKKGLAGSLIYFLPPVPLQEVPSILSGLDVAVLPGSTDIICPIKIQEYMAAELATIAPDYKCNREVITDGETGILFEPKNEAALAEKIMLLAKDETYRMKLGKQARTEIFSKFTWEKTWGVALELAIKSRI